MSKVVLSGKSFDESSARVFGEALGKFDSLKIADFSDVIASRPKEVNNAHCAMLGPALPCFCSVSFY